LENYIEDNDGVGIHVVGTKQETKHVPYGELVCVHHRMCNVTAEVSH